MFIKILGVSSAESLLNTVWLKTTIHFEMRGCQEHWNLCWEDVKLCKDAQGNEYLVNNKKKTKTRSGVDASNFRLKVSEKRLKRGVRLRLKFRNNISTFFACSNVKFMSKI